MKRIIFFWVVFSFVQYAIAALPPRYQNIKDLDVMVDYIKEHPKIASTLRSINLSEYTVYFGDDCTAVFGRKLIENPPGWVGPAAPLEFKESDCPVK